jgi:hypothetical protein
VRPTAHFQVLRDPFEAHRRFLSETRRQPHFASIAIAGAAQSFLIPAQSGRFLPHHSQSFGHPWFRAGLGRLRLCGLSIVKKMAEAMNGKVWCESELGRGATFIVEFPTTSL